MSGVARDAELFAACLQAVCDVLRTHEAELSDLDRAIGDGDHGANLNRAANALLAAAAELSALSTPQALERSGMLVVTSVGGASGPLYGSMLMALGRAWPAEPTAASIAAALEQSVGAVAKRGRSSVGEKTMLDVLVPAARAFQESVATMTLDEALHAMLLAADAGLESTKPLRATKGRAAYVGERSIGHFDPGAASARLCLHAVANAISQHHRTEQLS